MGSTNYANTFIRIADDCPATTGEEPPVRLETPTIAALQYHLVAERPYELTSDDVIFEVHARRSGIPEEAKAVERAAFFAKSQACLRTSPLAKRYGWGIHHDAEARIALVPVGSDRYRALADDTALQQLKASRSRRA